MAARKKVRTYEDVLIEAVLLTIEELKKTNKYYKNSDALLMSYDENGRMVKSISDDAEYRSSISKNFEILKKRYLDSDEYDGSGETMAETPSAPKDNGEEVNYGY